MALRELVTVLRYELREGNLKKYVDGYRNAEKAVNAVAQAANAKLKTAVVAANRELGAMNRTNVQAVRGMARLVHEAREFGIGLRQGARQGYGEVLRQLDRVEAKQRRIRRQGSAGAGERMGFAGGVLQGAVQGIIATVSGKAAMDAADVWSTTTGQIALQNESQVDRTRTREYLFTKAQQQGQDYATSVDTYTRMARNREVLKLTNDQVLQLTSTIGGMLALGGGSAQSQQAALTQFGQAMGAGQLRGEELNSVLEQAPVLANAIAKAFGITSDQLKKVAEDGKLTAKGIADGLLGQTKEVDDALKTLPMTFQRSFTQIRNQFTRLAGELSEKYKLAEKFNVAAQWVIQNMAKIGAAIGAIAGSWVAVKVFTALSSVFQTITALGRPLLLFFDRLAKGNIAQGFAKFGPAGLRLLKIFRGIGMAVSGIGVLGGAAFALIIGLVAVAAAVIYKYWEPIKAFFLGMWEGLKEGGAAAFDELLAAFAPLGPAFEEIGNWLKGIWDWFIKLLAPVNSTKEELDGAAASGKAFGELVMTNIRAVIAVIGLLVEGLVWMGEAAGTAFGWFVVAADNAWAGLKSGFGAVWDWIMEKIQSLTTVINTVSSVMTRLKKGGGGGLGDKFRIAYSLLSGDDEAVQGRLREMARSGGITPGQMATAGRSSVNQTITQTARVQVTAPPGGNPASFGAAAQRGTSKAFGSFDYRLPTPVEQF